MEQNLAGTGQDIRNQATQGTTAQTGNDQHREEARKHSGVCFFFSFSSVLGRTDGPCHLSPEN